MYVFGHEGGGADLGFRAVAESVVFEVVCCPGGNDFGKIFTGIVVMHFGAEVCVVFASLPNGIVKLVIGADVHGGGGSAR